MAHAILVAEPEDDVLQFPEYILVLCRDALLGRRWVEAVLDATLSGHRLPQQGLRVLPGLELARVDRLVLEKENALSCIQSILESLCEGLG